MSKWIKYPLVFVATLIGLFAIFFCYVYFSVDNRVSLEKPVAPFSNTRNIQRLDSVMLSPGTVTDHITALMKKANVHGLAVSIVNNQSSYTSSILDSATKVRMNLLLPEPSGMGHR